MTDDRANADLHRELEERTFRALCAVYQSRAVQQEDFAALCYSAGFSPWQVRKHLDVNEATMRG